MAAMSSSDEKFIQLWQRLKSGTAVANTLGVGLRQVLRRRRGIEQRHGVSLAVEMDADSSVVPRRHVQVKNGTVLVFSDAHYQPGPATTAHKALVALCKQLEPVMVIGNGDLADFAELCRQDPTGWEKNPSVNAEIAAVRERLWEIRQALPENTPVYRTRGNHDLRFERTLAMNVSKYEDIHGFKLSDHIPDWPESWSIWINENVVVKHRWKGGVHATWNNVKDAGLSFVHGHDHALKVTPYTDYTETRWGLDTGTLADPYAKSFLYSEDNPRNWRSGLGVLTFEDSKLLPPELCEVVRGVPYFRGRRVKTTK